MNQSNKSPISIPEQIIGECQIIHNFEGGRKTHLLVSKSNGTWMTDVDSEIDQMHQAIREVRAHGKGLVGGLGLGIVAELLGKLGDVTSIDIVERSYDVVNLVMPNLKCKNKCRVIVGDIYDFIKSLKSWDYDFAIFDTWRGVGKEIWLLQVMPLRRIIANKFGKVNLHNWREYDMFLEVTKTLTTKKPYWILDKLPLPMSASDAIWFTQNVGLPEWEKLYGDKIYDKNEII